MKTSKITEMILITIEDTVSNFLYYDRKEDEELPRGAIEKAIEDGDISVDEIIEKFYKCLRKSLEDEAEETESEIDRLRNNIGQIHDFIRDLLDRDVLVHNRVMVQESAPGSYHKSYPSDDECEDDCMRCQFEALMTEQDAQ